MDAQQFLAEFRHIANAPGGVAQLRELVLQLAVQGKLFPQDAADTPASELLKEIAAEKQQLVKEGKLKAPKSLAPLKLEEAPYSLPRGWEWVRLGNIAEIERGGSPRPIDSFLTDDPDGLNWIKISDTEKGSKFITSTKEKIKTEGLIKTRMVYPGDFLLTNSMSFGRPYITAIEGCIHDGWLRIHPPSNLEKNFLYCLLSSPFVAAFFRKAAAGAVVQNLNADKVRDLPISLPPLAEQARIVAKVDELMALCDKMEVQKQELDKLRRLIRTAMFDTLADVQSGRDLKEAWTRIETNISVLIREPADVSHLKSVILSLAANGFLEDGCEGDSDASRLLDSIFVIQQQEFTNREHKELKTLLEPITVDRHRIKLPLGHIVKVISGQHLTPSEYNISGDGIPYITGPAEFGARFPEPNKWTRAMRAVAKEDDILLTVKGSGVGKTAICNSKELAISRQLMAIRALGKLDKEYLSICIDAAKHRFQAQKFGIAIPGIGREEVLSLEMILPSCEEQSRIVRKTRRLLEICDSLELQLKTVRSKSAKFVTSAISTITGTHIEEEEGLKTPKTELIAKLRLANSPDIKEQAPLAAILARHHDEMPAADLWQRYGGDIDTFYAQLKLEVGKGWIEEPAIAEMRETEAG